MGEADDRADRLAAIAVDLAARVRDQDPDDNAEWLMSVVGDAGGLFDLLFVQAAAGPATVDAFRRATAWARNRPGDVDEVAVERACAGDPVPLNDEESALVIQTLLRRGQLVDRVIAERAGVSRRFVQRVKARLRATGNLVEAG